MCEDEMCLPPAWGDEAMMMTGAMLRWRLTKLVLDSGSEYLP